MTTSALEQLWVHPSAELLAKALAEADDVCLGVLGKTLREQLSLTRPPDKQTLAPTFEKINQLGRLLFLEGAAYGWGKTARPSAEDIQLGRALRDWLLGQFREMPWLQPLVAKKVADRTLRALQPFRRMSKAIPGKRGRPGRDPDVVIDLVETYRREKGWSKTKAVDEAAAEMEYKDNRAVWKMYEKRARRSGVISDPTIIEPEKAWVDAAGRREQTKYPSNAPRSKPRTSPA
ncbi:MAG: hypothetical protein K6T59_01985 [Bryobacteraceae bacterium]|nr:hypothetical protein [Bryobacteraceae bacterium]